MQRQRQQQMAKAKPELLAPAGDAECFAAALQFGADAVYVGAKEYGMRAAAKNFDFDALQKAVQTAHAQGVLVYLTANVLPRNAEMDAFPEFIKHVESCGVDAVIAADLGVITQIRALAPKLTVHASTQTGVVNLCTRREARRTGAGTLDRRNRGAAKKNAARSRNRGLCTRCNVHERIGTLSALGISDGQRCKPRCLCAVLPLEICAHGREASGAVFPC